MNSPVLRTEHQPSEWIESGEVAMDPAPLLAITIDPIKVDLLVPQTSGEGERP